MENYVVKQNSGECRVNEVYALAEYDNNSAVRVAVRLVRVVRGNTCKEISTPLNELLRSLD